MGMPLSKTSRRSRGYSLDREHCMEHSTASRDSVSSQNSPPKIDDILTRSHRREPPRSVATLTRSNALPQLVGFGLVSVSCDVELATPSSHRFRDQVLSVILEETTW